MRFAFALVIVGVCVVACHAADDLQVLPESMQPKQMLTRYLKEQAKAAFERRKAAYEKIKTTGDVAEYQQRVRKLLLAELGELPERTPLNAKVVGELKGDGYRAEKVLFESQPRHHVAAVLFLPAEAKAPCPGVLVPAGHSRDGKASNQRVCILLAKNGIAAMCYDPIGQGERVQILDENGKQKFKMTDEHTLLGATSMLVGRGTATYRIWDGMRAIDYLASRPEIDAKRIGVTGCSGGGTMTSYLMALDERVACAAPSCYLTSFERLLATIGPQDAEQNIHAQIAQGIDHADYLTLRAPTPTLVLASTRDFFDISGTWDSYRQAKRIYTRLGRAERLQILETDETHGYPKLQREAMASWMNRWLLHNDASISEPEIITPKEAEVLCTPRGQVMLLEGERSVSDLNVELDAKLAEQRKELWKDKAAALAKVREVAGIRNLADIPEPAVRETGVIDHTVVRDDKTEGYKIHKLVIEPEPGIVLPALLYQPAKVTGKKYLYLDSEGKTDFTSDVEKLFNEGNVVLAVDLRGMGETGPEKTNLFGGDWNEIFLSYLLGKSMVGMRAEDILVSARYLSKHEASKDKQVHVIAVAAAGPPAMHATALEPALFAHLQLDASLLVWPDYLKHPEEKGQMVNSVHRALRYYDLLDLAHSFKNVFIRFPVLDQ
jgi:dienelactone hydrolase